MSDPDLLVELRSWRDEFARSHGYDVTAMAAFLRELDKAAGTRVVQAKPRQPETVPQEDSSTAEPGAMAGPGR